MMLKVRRARLGGGDVPFALIALAVVGVQLLTVGNVDLHRRLVAALGFSWSDLAAGRVLRLLTSSFVQTAPGVRQGIMLLLLMALLSLVFRVEPRRAVPLWFVGDIVASVTMAATYRLLAGIGVAAAAQRLAMRDAGSSSGAHALIAAGLLTLETRRQRVIGIVGLMLAQVPFIVVRQNPAYVHHVVAILATVLAVGGFNQVSPA